MKDGNEEELGRKECCLKEYPVFPCEMRRIR
jgi:hypothetical protein